MSVENEIKELERKLALKRAYLAATVSFGKGYKAFPDDVREEVITNLREYAAKMAAGEPPAQSNSLTEQEVTVLKALAKTVLEKSAAQKTVQKTTTNEPKNEPIKQEKPEQPDYAKDSNSAIKIGSKANLLMLDSVPADQRMHVHPGAEVTVIADRKYRVMVEDPKGNRFWIPREDIELIELTA